MRARRLACLALACASCGEGSGGAGGGTSAAAGGGAEPSTSTGSATSAGGGAPTTSGTGGGGGGGSGGAGVGGAEALAEACFLAYSGEGQCSGYACNAMRPHELQVTAETCSVTHLDYHCFVGSGFGVGEPSAYFRVFSGPGPRVIRLNWEGGFEGWEDCSLGDGIPECCCWTNRPTDGTCDGIEPLGPEDFEVPE